MQCSNCLCSVSQEVVVGSVTYHECDWCGNLMATEAAGDSDLEQELNSLHLKLQEANAIIARLRSQGGFGSASAAARNAAALPPGAKAKGPC